ALARRSDKRSTADGEMQGLCCRALIALAEMRHRQDCSTLSGGHFTYRLQYTAHLGVLVAVGLPHVRTDRIYIDQGNLADLGDLLFQQVEIGLQIEDSLAFAIRCGDGVYDVDALEIGADYFEARHNRVLHIVLGIQNNDIAPRRAAFSAGPLPASGYR